MSVPVPTLPTSPDEGGVPVEAAWECCRLPNLAYPAVATATTTYFDGDDRHQGAPMVPPTVTFSDPQFHNLKP